MLVTGYWNDSLPGPEGRNSRKFDYIREPVYCINVMMYMFPFMLSFLWLILTQQSMQGIEYGKSGHLYVYINFFEALNDAFEV